MYTRRGWFATERRSPWLRNSLYRPHCLAVALVEIQAGVEPGLSPLRRVSCSNGTGRIVGIDTSCVGSCAARMNRSGTGAADFSRLRIPNPLIVVRTSAFNRRGVTVSRAQVPWLPLGIPYR